MSKPDQHQHNCGFVWCKTTCADPEHWWLEYTYASLRSGDPYHLTAEQSRHKVGIGLSYDEGDVPCVVVHLDGGPRDHDADAHLKISEAVALRDLLDRGIASACEALQHMAGQMIGSVQVGGNDESVITADERGRD